MHIRDIHAVYEPVFRLVPWCRPTCPLDPALRVPGDGHGLIPGARRGARQVLRFVRTGTDEMGRDLVTAWWFSDAGLSLVCVDATAAQMLCRQAVLSFLSGRAWRLEMGRAAAPGASDGEAGDRGARGVRVWAREGVDAVWGYDAAEPGALDRVFHAAVCWMVSQADAWASGDDLRALRRAAALNGCNGA